MVSLPKFLDYFSCFDLDNPANKALFQEEIQHFIQLEDLNAREYNFAVGYLRKLGLKIEAEMLYDEWVEKYPEDKYVLSFEFGDVLKDFSESTNFKQKQNVNRNYLEKYKDIKPENKFGLDINTRYLLANLVHENITEDLFGEWQKEANKLNPEIMLGTF